MRSEFNEAFKENRQEGKSYSAEYKLGALWAWNHQQTKVDELQKRVDAQKKHIETALLAVKNIHKSALDEFMEWDVLAEKAPKLCQHMQDLSIAVGELEHALKGGNE